MSTSSRYLVTGDGALGRALTSRLRANGDSVVVVSRPMPDSSAEVVSIDLGRASAADGNLLRDLLSRTDGVFHTAGLQGWSEASTAEYIEANVAGTVALLKAMADAGPGKLVHASTIGVYGEVHPLTIDAETPPRPDLAFPYSASKAIAELCVEAFALAGTVDAVALRFGGFVEQVRERLGGLPRDWAVSGGLVALQDVVTASMCAMRGLPLPRFGYVIAPTTDERATAYHVDSTATTRELDFTFGSSFESFVTEADGFEGTERLKEQQ